jgi:hypothetical protein
VRIRHLSLRTADLWPCTIRWRLQSHPGEEGCQTDDDQNQAACTHHSFSHPPNTAAPAAKILCSRMCAETPIPDWLRMVLREHRSTRRQMSSAKTPKQLRSFQGLKTQVADRGCYRRFVCAANKRGTGFNRWRDHPLTGRVRWFRLRQRPSNRSSFRIDGHPGES